MSRECFLRYFLILFLFFISFSLGFSEKFNAGGTFSVEVENRKINIFEGNIDAKFEMTIFNNLDEKNSVNLKIKDTKDWKFSFSEKIVEVDPKKNVKVSFDAKFLGDIENYIVEILSPELIELKNVKKQGVFYFPFSISSTKNKNEIVAFPFSVIVDADYELNPKVEVKILSNKVSLKNEFEFSYLSKILNQDLEFSVFFDNVKLKEVYISNDKKDNFKIIKAKIPKELEPKEYNVKILIEKTNINPKKQWEFFGKVNVLEYENLVIKEDYKSNFFSKSYFISIENLGNKETTFSKKIDSIFLKNLFLSSNQDFKKTLNDVTFEIDVKSGEFIVVNYTYNYTILYVVVLLLTFIFGYFIYQKLTIPIKLNVKLRKHIFSEFDTLEEAGFRISLENITKDIFDEVRIIITIPNYLSFCSKTLSHYKPSKILKSAKNYKIIYEFEYFGFFETKIINYKIKNYTGIIGDISLPKVELEYLKDDKVKMYKFRTPKIINDNLKNEKTDE